jgi:hypothetical protein
VSRTVRGKREGPKGRRGRPLALDHSASSRGKQAPKGDNDEGATGLHDMGSMLRGRLHVFVAQGWELLRSGTPRRIDGESCALTRRLPLDVVGVHPL